MSFSNAAVKQTAKTFLKNKYSGGVAAASLFLFVYLACYLLLSIVSVFSNAFIYFALSGLTTVFLFIPLILGFAYWGVRLTSVGDNEPMLVFYYFTSLKKYKRALAVCLQVAVTAIIAGIILFLPCYLTELIASGKLFIMLKMQIPDWAPGLWALSGVLKAAAIVIFILIMLNYYLAPFLMAADENMEPFEAMHMSKVISRRSRGGFILLVLSFAGYILACYFMLPAIFILPYFAAAYTMHCRFAVHAYNSSVDDMHKPDIPSFNADMSI